jgi:hypothetical protein
MGDDNVDHRLLERFQASWEHQRVRRELLPPVWINAEPSDDGPLGDLFEDVLERARARIRMEREAVESARDGLDSAV